MTTIIHQYSSQTPVPVNDRSFNYGDGFFTTILCQHKKLTCLDLHLKRLKHSADILQFGPLSWDKLTCSLIDVAQSMPTNERYVVKVLISRGAGGRGYGTSGLSPFIYITQADYPGFYDDWRENGIDVGVSEIQLGLNPLLGGIKHNNRLEQVMIKNALEDLPFDDVVVCDLNANVVECSASNLFWQSHDQWYTPIIDMAGVEGITKHYLIDKMTALAQTNQVKRTITSLYQAQGLFICNCLMGIVPVRSITTPTGSKIDFSIGVTHQLSDDLQRMNHDA
jgi:4-amino-4-deoxychorismate lyase